MVYFGFYLIFINVISVIICVADKIKASMGSWRIPEKTLLILSLIGGSVGMYIAMRIVRHKTKHKKFMIGIPLIILLQCALLIAFLHVSS